MRNTWLRNGSRFYFATLRVIQWPTSSTTQHTPSTPSGIGRTRGHKENPLPKEVPLSLFSQPVAKLEASGCWGEAFLFVFLCHLLHGHMFCMGLRGSLDLHEKNWVFLLCLLWVPRSFTANGQYLGERRCERPFEPTSRQPCLKADIFVHLALLQNKMPCFFFVLCFTAKRQYFEPTYML